MQILVSLTEMNGEGSPLLTAGMKCSIFNMEISRAHSLWSEAIKEGYSRAWLDTYCNTDMQ